MDLAMPVMTGYEFLAWPRLLFWSRAPAGPLELAKLMDAVHHTARAA